MSWFFKLLLGASIFGVFGVAFVVWAMLPNASYVHAYDNMTKIAYIHIYDDAIARVDVDPACYDEIRETMPSPGFGIAYSYCDKRSHIAMDIDQRWDEGEWEVLSLKYRNPGEKGEGYRAPLSVSEGEAVYNRTSYTRTSPWSIFRYITR